MRRILIFDFNEANPSCLLQPEELRGDTGSVVYVLQTSSLPVKSNK